MRQKFNKEVDDKSTKFTEKEKWKLYNIKKIKAENKIRRIKGKKDRERGWKKKGKK